MSGFWIPKVLDKSVFQFMFSIFVVGVVLHAPILGDRSGPSHEHRRVSQLPLSTLLRDHWKGKSLFVYDVTQLRLFSDQLNHTMTGDLNNKHVNIQMVKMCPVVKWLSIHMNTKNILTKHLNTKTI